jgi:hypothetical protein
MSLSVTPVPDPSKLAAPPALRSEAHMPASREAMTPLKTMKLILTIEIADYWFINFMNVNLSRDRKPGSKSESHDIDYNELWRFIGHRLSVAHPQFHNRTTKLDGTTGHKHPLEQYPHLGQKRYKRLRVALSGVGLHANDAANAICAQIRSLYFASNLLIIDETMLEYAGLDMICRCIDMFIERKPHPFGVEVFLSLWLGYLVLSGIESLQQPQLRISLE